MPGQKSLFFDTSTHRAPSTRSMDPASGVPSSRNTDGLRLIRIESFWIVDRYDIETFWTKFLIVFANGDDWKIGNRILLSILYYFLYHLSNHILLANENFFLQFQYVSVNSSDFSFSFTARRWTEQNNRISLVRRAPRYNTPDIIVRLIRWPVDKRYRARLIQLADVSRREPIPSTVLAVLPAFTFLPPAFKARFPRDFFSWTGYYAADNSGCQVKYDGDAFCEKLAIRFFRMGDIMRYYAEKVEGTWSGSAFFLYKCSSCLLWLPRQCTKQRILNILRVFLYIPLYFESCDPHKSDS